MPNKTHESITEDVLINQLHRFVECHLEYNKDRTHTSTEKALLERARNFAEQHPSINLERSEEANLRTACAHATTAWALFSACAFSNGQLLSRNELKLAGMVPVSGVNRGTSLRNRNFVSTSELVTREANLLAQINLYSRTFSSIFDYSSVRQITIHEILKEKFLKKYEKRGKSGSLKDRFKEIFSHPSMQRACTRLCEAPIIAIGDGIADCGLTLDRLNHDISFDWLNRKDGEYPYKRMNIRVIAVRETDKEFIQNLIRIINPELERTVVFLTIEEIKKFESDRKNRDESHKLPYIIDFLNAFSLAKPLFKVPSAVMKPVRIDMDLIAVGSKGSLYQKDGEVVCYEEVLEKSPREHIEDFCNDAVQCGDDFVELFKNLGRLGLEDNPKLIWQVIDLEIIFEEYARFYEREFSLYPYLYGETIDNGITDPIEHARNALSRVRGMIQGVKDCLGIHKIIIRYRNELSHNGEPSSIQDIPLKRDILEFWEAVIYQFKSLLFAPSKEGQLAYHEQFLKENLKELVENICSKITQSYHELITLVQNLTKQPNYPIEDYHAQLNSIVLIAEAYNPFIRDLFNKCPSDSLSERAEDDIRALRDLVSKEIINAKEKCNTLEILSHHRDIDKEKKLISEMRNYRNKLLLSKRDPNTAKSKAESLFKITNMCEEIEKNNLSTALISEIRGVINQENETLRIHRHACTLTPFLQVLSFFKPTMLEKRVDSIKLTGNLDNYLNSLEDAISKSR